MIENLHSDFDSFDLLLASSSYNNGNTKVYVVDKTSDYEDIVYYINNSDIEKTKKDRICRD